MEEELDFSLFQNKTQNRPYPKFLIYKIIKIDGIYCWKYMKFFDYFFYLKSNYLQVELNIKEKCLYCIKFYPRVKEHFPHCTKFLKKYFKSFF